MPFKFPYTNFQELNLDWIIKKVKDLSKQIESDSSVVSEYIDRLLAVEEKADNAEATANSADARATGANTTANSALTLATQAKQNADTATTNVNLLTLKIGDLSSLYTTAKDSIVNAINEIWGIFHNARAVTNVMPAGSDPAVTYSNGVFTFDLPAGGDPDAVTRAELDAAIDGVEDSIDALSDRVDDLSEELDNKADVIIDTASGDIASFPDGTATPLKSLIVNIEPRQAGSGTPSPSNIRPISGWTGCEVWRTGKNLLDDTIRFRLNTSILYLNATNATDRNLFLKAGTYIPSLTGTTAPMLFYVQSVDEEKSCRADLGATITITKSGFFKAWIYSPTEVVDDVEHVQLELGSTATAYEEYRGNFYSVAFGKTLYHANIDVISGGGTGLTEKVVYNGTVGGSSDFASVEVGQYTDQDFTMFVLTLQNPARYSSNGDILAIYAMCNILPWKFANQDGTAHWYKSARVGVFIPASIATTVEEFNAFAAHQPLEFVLALAYEEQETITPTPITALKGYNNIWSDAGAMEVTYRADTKGYIDKLIAQVQALALGG